MKPDHLLAALLLLLGAEVAHATVTGMKKCTKAMCITGLHDSDKMTDTYTLTGPEGKDIPLSEFGWIAMGFGQGMANSPMIIAWPNSDGSITLSQRQAPGEVAPSVTSNAARKATLLQSQSFANTSSTSITFTLPSNSSSSSSLNQTQLIWAYSSQNPKSSSASASIQQHSSAGSLVMPLLATYNPVSSGSTATDPAPGSGSDASGGSGDGDSGEGGLPNHKALVAHALCGGLATLIFFPIGTLVPRLARGFSLNRWWFPAHSALNGVVGGILIIVTYALSQAYLGGDDMGQNSSHRSLGLVLFILVLVQIALGIIVHWWKSSIHQLQTRSGRGPTNFLHFALGIATVVIGWVTTWTGMEQEWPRWSGTNDLSVGWEIFWGIIVGLTILIYAGGLALIPRQRRMEAEQRERHAGLAASGMAMGERGAKRGGERVEVQSTEGAERGVGR